MLIRNCNFKVITFILLATLPGVAKAAGFQFGGIRHDLSTTTSSAGTLTLTSSSRQVQQILGSTTHTVVMPAANTLKAGYWFIISNDSSGTVTVNANGGALLTTLTTDQSAAFYLSSDVSTAGVWDVQKGAGAGGGGGSPGSVSSTYANSTYLAWMRVNAACSGTCVISEQSGDFVAPTQNSTGSYAGTFASSGAVWGGGIAPVCGAHGEDDQIHTAILSVTTTGFQIRNRNTSGTFEDRAFTVICVGKHD